MLNIVTKEYFLTVIVTFLNMIVSQQYFDTYQSKY